VLIMSVNPGFGGQAFIPYALDKLAAARRRIERARRDIWLEVDGGVKAANISAIARAGADTFVAGSAIFGVPSYAQAIAELRAAIAQATQGEYHRDHDAEALGEPLFAPRGLFRAAV
jgi:ribulose-phosphate 3-epimerase